jgi:small subunit ribosomal protein S3
LPIKTHFVLKGLQRIRIDEYLDSELKRAGYGGADIQKTPLGTRLTIYATRPGFVIGRRGKTVRELTEALKRVFAIDNPQIEVAEVEVPEFDAKIMAAKLASSLERGFQYRRAVYSVMRRIMEAGAKGTEITISGKLSSQRARYQKFKDGVVTKCGEPVKTFVREATSPAFMKPGVMGVRVVVMLPGELPDKIKVKYPEIPQPVAQPAAQPAAQPLASMPEGSKGEAPKTGEAPVKTETKAVAVNAEELGGPQKTVEAKQTMESREIAAQTELAKKAAPETAKESTGKKPRKKKEEKKAGRKKEGKKEKKGK